MRRRASEALVEVVVCIGIYAAGIFQHGIATGDCVVQQCLRHIMRADNQSIGVVDCHFVELYEVYGSLAIGK